MSRELRNRLVDELKTDADFNAFCIDEFPDIHRGFAETANRQQRINALFQVAGAQEVSRKLNEWLAQPSQRLLPASMRRHVIWAAIGVSGLAFLTLSILLLTAYLRPQPQPQVIVVPIADFNRQLAAHGLTLDRLDSPAQFAAKVQDAGPRNVRYEVSFDRDRETQELMRLVLALRVQNDQLVAATKYLLGQVQKWQHKTTTETQLLSKLAQEIEGKIQIRPVADMAIPYLPDLAIPPPDLGHPEPKDLAVPPPVMPPPKVGYRPQMIPIPAGTFTMGSDEYQRRPHTVTLSRFYFSATEVTQAQYLAVIGRNPSHFSDRPDWQKLPVESVNWFDAVAYCNALSKREGLEECYVVRGHHVQWPKKQACHGYRLPTEAEWEYAALAGAKTTYAGSDSIDDVAWYGGNSGSRTHPVGQKRANRWGLYDLSGNVWEWVWDFSGSYSFLQAKKMDPTGPDSGDSRVDRGGSWVHDARDARIAVRANSPPSYGYRALGIRLARSAP